jgi:ribonucleoside-triphosphate reductase
VGDSAEAWAKAAGKLVAGKYPAETLVLDFSQIRPAGYRLKGYGWISSGDQQISEAFRAIAKILSDRADQLLTAIDILDICNWLGTILSSRRSAQIALLDAEHHESEEFAAAKKDYWLNGKEHRRQSNNSVVFHTRPSLQEIETFLTKMVAYGGSEPGLINAANATKRAPWFQGVNPCGEILLGNKSFCNLVEVNLVAFKGDRPGLERALHLMARANYRQTMVYLEDGILQEAWHRQNAFLHLCGVGLTGIAARPDLRPYDYKRFSAITKHAAYSMAEELDTPLPKNVTTIKPSGTVSKVMSTREWGEVPEGIHFPLGRYIFNWITYSVHDPLVDIFRKANYEIMEKPNEPESVLVKFPVRYDNVPFERKLVARIHDDMEVVEELEVNTETAIEQLERYKMLMENWCDHNVSITVSYDPQEIPEIAQWLDFNWDNYVAVSFMLRNDPTKTAADLGHPYLPQELVTEEDWNAYYEGILPVDWTQVHHHDGVVESCPLGGCPVK